MSFTFEKNILYSLSFFFLLNSFLTIVKTALVSKKQIAWNLNTLYALLQADERQYLLWFKAFTALWWHTSSDVLHMHLHSLHFFYFAAISWSVFLHWCSPYHRGSFYHKIENLLQWKKWDEKKGNEIEWANGQICSKLFSDLSAIKSHEIWAWIQTFLIKFSQEQMIWTDDELCILPIHVYFLYCW